MLEHKLIDAYADIVRKEFGEAFLKKRGKCQHVIVIGSIGSGKSTSLEDFVELRYGKGDVILDLFDAGDFENCFYAVKGQARFPILLLYPLDVKVKSRDDHVKPVCVDSADLKHLLTQAKKENRIICFVPGLYRDDAKMFDKIADIARNIHRINFDLGYNITVVLREAANIVYSSFKSTEFREQLEAKRALIRLMRVGRHYGIRFLIDTQRFQDVAPCFRENPFWIVVKRMRPENLPSDLAWLPSSVKKVLPKLGNDQAVVLSPSNTYIFSSRLLFCENSFSR